MKHSQFAKDYLGGQDTAAASMLAGTAGEIAACTLRVPVEVVKQRAQATGAGSSLSAAKYVVGLGSDRGMLGVWREMYRGYGVTIMREIPFTIIQFPLWEGLKKWTVKWRGGGDRRATGAEGAVCGSIAGGVAAAITTPLDVLKTRMMLSEKVILCIRACSLQPRFANKY